VRDGAIRIRWLRGDQLQAQAEKLANGEVDPYFPGRGGELPILEVADVFVANKADRESADQAVRDLLYMLCLAAGTPSLVPGGRPSSGRSPPGPRTTTRSRLGRDGNQQDRRR
jgi:hypothetical protein